ncbi:MAG TPA: FHA domain-containing protein [Chloroflexi bacterium]|nr:FHA domain-containing protein [Chloroflexota bacterium]
MPAPSFQLSMRTGPAPGKVFALSQDEITIGRDVSNDFIINDVEVSRRHARLSRQGMQFVIEDLGSTNGTFINGQRLAGPHVLRVGDVILLGENVTLVFEETSYDPNATVASPAMAAPAGPPPPPPQAYSPQMAPSSAPTGDLENKLPPQQPQKSSKVPCLAIGCVSVIVLCLLVVGALWYIDSHYLWCTVAPFIPGCP